MKKGGISAPPLPTNFTDQLSADLKTSGDTDTVEVLDLKETVILVTGGCSSSDGEIDFLGERIGDHAVAGLETNLRLESILTD